MANQVKTEAQSVYHVDTTPVKDLTREQADQIIEQARQLIRLRFQPKAKIHSTTDARNFVMLELAMLENEAFMVIYLTNQHEVIESVVEFQGTISSCSVHPRVIAKRALMLNASAIILAHNHPSGSNDPSSADVRITETIKKAVDLIEVRVLDHLVVAGESVVSMAEQGLI